MPDCRQRRKECASATIKVLRTPYEVQIVTDPYARAGWTGGSIMHAGIHWMDAPPDRLSHTDHFAVVNYRGVDPCGKHHCAGTWP